MYAINLNTATPRDIIRRSIVCHPSLLRDRMRDIARIHAQYAATTHDQRSKATAGRLMAACNYVAAIIENTGNETADEMATKITLLGMDYWISTLNIAAKLQCIPFATISDVVSRMPQGFAQNAE